MNINKQDQERLMAVMVSDTYQLITEFSERFPVDPQNKDELIDLLAGALYDLIFNIENKDIVFKHHGAESNLFALLTIVYQQVIKSPTEAGPGPAECDPTQAATSMFTAKP